MSLPTRHDELRRTGCLSHLAKDTSGNVMAILTFALIPMLALIGGGIDVGRGYLAQARLQQACDAGVLAARKRLGTQVAVDGNVPADVAATGQRFFNLNFQEGAYGTQNRRFAMALENDFSMTGTASVDVPTTLMQLFDFNEVSVSVSCGSIQNFSNLDVMMVVDTTGSMRQINAGDSLSRMESLKEVVRGFHATIDAAKAPGTRVRYGFVPYNTNVNVGHLLEDDWVVESWNYQGREDTGSRVKNEEGPHYTYQHQWVEVSGTRSPWVEETSYAATWTPGVGDQQGRWSCSQPNPAGTWDFTDTIDQSSKRVEKQEEPKATLHKHQGERVHNGTRFQTRIQDNTCIVESSTDTNFVQSFEQVRVIPARDREVWRYGSISLDVSDWRNETDGCIEERDTYRILDFDNVDFTRALDLDIDLVPTANDPSTQWRPRYPEMIFARSMLSDGNGEFTPAEVETTDNYVAPGNWWFSDCPPPAQKLSELTSSELDAYLDTLEPYGATYHDIGMIWGGRLLSPTGLYASENADTGSMEVSRHMIWLTDGQTEPYDLAYGAYGIDGLDQRRWIPGGSQTLAANVEARFGVACEQVKNRDIIVWVVAFGTTLNPIMEECAGPGRSFEAANADELNEAFQEIAASMSELRIAR